MMAGFSRRKQPAERNWLIEQQAAVADLQKASVHTAGGL
jgi:hypothetical protein